MGSNPTVGRYFSIQVYLNGEDEIWSQVFGGFSWILEHADAEV